MSDTPTPAVENRVTVRLNDSGPPSMVINDVEVTGMITPDWSLVATAEQGGGATALLTVTYPVWLS